MNDKTEVKPNDGSLMENVVRFRVSNEDKNKIRDYFGSFSDMRDFVLEVVEDKGDKVKREVEKQK